MSVSVNSFRFFKRKSKDDPSQKSWLDGKSEHHIKICMTFITMNMESFFFYFFFIFFFNLINW